MTKLQVFHARDFADLEKEMLWMWPNEKIRMIFDDGEVECYWREAVLSSYCWKLQRNNPKILLSKDHLITLPINKGSVNKMWEKILRDNKDNWEKYDLNEQNLSEVIIKEINKLFNDSVRYLTKYTTSSGAKELREIVHHPVMEAIYAELNRTGSSTNMHGALRKAYREADDFVRNHPDMKHNNFSMALRLGLIDGRQFLQVIIARGATNDIDNNQFRQAVLTGYARGIHNIIWSAQESRGASIAALQAKDPVQASDYLKRRLEIITEIIRNIVPGDCGTNETIPWYVQKDDLVNLQGVYHQDESGQLLEITKDCKHLIGQTIQIRVAAVCHKLHEGSVCQTCMGRVSSYIPYFFSFGHIAVINALGAFVQLSLSAKHLIVSREQVIFALDTTTAKYLKFPRQDNQNELVLQPKVLQKGIETEFIFNVSDLNFLADVANNVSAEDVQISTASFIDTCSISLADKSGNNLREVLNVSDIGRKSNLSREFIEYVLNNKDMITMVRNAVKINLAKWESKYPIFSIPYKITGTKDFMKKFESTIRTGMIKHNIDAQNPAGISDMMRLCYQIVKECVEIPVSHLGVMIAAMLVRNKSKLDYRLPLPNGTREFDTMGNIYGFRSVAQTMAYERRLMYLRSPLMLLPSVRTNHPFDTIYFPEIEDPYRDIDDIKKRNIYPEEILPSPKDK